MQTSRFRDVKKCDSYHMNVQKMHFEILNSLIPYQSQFDLGDTENFKAI